LAASPMALLGMFHVAQRERAAVLEVGHLAKRSARPRDVPSS
jgi:hypothetical protein